MFVGGTVHVHMHAGEAPLIHAHLPELVADGDESVVHMEAFHSHAAAGPLDLLTTTIVRVVHFGAAIVSSVVVSNNSFTFRSYLTAGEPVAHGPPVSELEIPRAPPA
jgi:hypothetical protein